MTNEVHPEPIDIVRTYGTDWDDGNGLESSANAIASLDGDRFYFPMDAPSGPGLEGGADKAVVTDEFILAMRSLVSAVVIVTSYVAGRPWGLTVSSCCSLSASPPRFLVALGTHTRSCKSILSTGYFGASVLGECQRSIAARTAAPGVPKFLDGNFCVVSADPGKAPIIRDAPYHLQCTVSQVHNEEDHVIVIGTVTSVLIGEQEQTPLLYFNRAFHRLGLPM